MQMQNCLKSSTAQKYKKNHQFKQTYNFIQNKHLQHSRLFPEFETLPKKQTFKLHFI